MGEPFPRRDFLRLAAGSATLLVGAGCRSPSGGEPSDADANRRSAGADRPGTLRIAQWNHYVAGYDQWWDQEYTKAWGERNGVEVVVDHFDINQALAHAEAEVTSQRGHDLFHLVSSPVAFEDHVIDHRDVVEEIEGKVGKMRPFVERSIFNPKTRKYLGCSDTWWPNPVHYRTDLWTAVGRRPDTWEDVLVSGIQLKAQGHPIGIGLSDELESNLILSGLIHAYGGAIQDEAGRVAINTRATVEAVKLGAALLRSAMTPDVFGWDIASNNRYLISGRGSLILNSIAALRALETQDPALAAKVQLRSVPEGPAGRLSPYVVGVYMIWRFSKNQEAAKQFLVDLAAGYREAFLRSQYLQLPSFPGAVGDLEALLVNDARSEPPGKYNVLAGAHGWTTNVGHPGYTNVAVDEVVRASIIPQMFAAAARDEMSAEDSVRAAEERMKPIYDKWRQQGKI